MAASARAEEPHGRTGRAAPAEAAAPPGRESTGSGEDGAVLLRHAQYSEVTVTPVNACLACRLT
ncbi:hypothetical protein C5N14_08965 [Micromonospora sp. MW-13]|nr:hypothetical protein C5N14_08965 [Micromonospora sp. MW-13]